MALPSSRYFPPHLARQLSQIDAGICRDPRTDRRWGVRLPDLGRPCRSGDRVAVQTEAVDGRRDPKRKTKRAA